MTHVRIFYVFVFSLFAGCNCFENRISFRDKYLLYSKAVKSDDTDFYADFFTADINDTIFDVDYKFGTRYKTPPYTDLEGHLIALVLPEASNCVYKIIKNKRYVYFEYYHHGKAERKKKYSITINDTFVVSPGFVTTLYTGDTTILFYNNKIKCRKYLCHVPLPYSLKQGDYFIEKYLDKKSYLPVVINEIYYPNYHSPAFSRDSVVVKSYILRCLLDKDEVKSKEWEYPQCYKVFAKDD